VDDGGSPERLLRALDRGRGIQGRRRRPRRGQRRRRPGTRRNGRGRRPGRGRRGRARRRSPETRGPRMLVSNDRGQLQRRSMAHPRRRGGRDRSTARSAPRRRVRMVWYD
jgi:hypothetical protein